MGLRRGAIARFLESRPGRSFSGFRFSRAAITSTNQSTATLRLMRPFGSGLHYAPLRILLAQRKEQDQRIIVRGISYT